MLDKRNMKIIIQRFYLHLKGLRVNFILPILIADIFLPIVCMITYKSDKSNLLFSDTVIRFSVLLIPLCSVWWSIFINRYYIEGKGNELLYVCKNKIKLTDTLISFVVFYIIAIFQFLFYINIDNALMLEPLKLFVVSFFYYSLVQFFSFLTGSVAITLLSVVSCDLFSFLLSATSSSTFFNIYNASKEIILLAYLPLFIFSIALLIVSVILNKKRLRFN